MMRESVILNPNKMKKTVEFEMKACIFGVRTLLCQIANKYRRRHIITVLPDEQRSIAYRIYNKLLTLTLTFVENSVGY